ncbi:AAA family ATPase [Streptomyces sp. HNM0663]|uniref:AAA family ATPase n=1 Tax=Streptomyces chengmaiensis TaxID=3040919 RepID=A0ABT6HSA9_9ACTN|nr:AAA family ATPase [Streptomyces chengmaiensis]MDH2391601.1 AAA family ATPase [Streptomyces chengmaiensis]
MYKDAETSLRKSDRLGDRAAVYLLVDRSYLMKNYFTDGTVQRLSDNQILSLSAHLDDGKVLVGAASSPAECTPSREAACSAAPRPSSTSHSAPTRAASPSCTAGFRSAECRCPAAIFTHILPRKREVFMPASTIVASGGEFRLYGDSVQTFADLPVATYTISFSQVAGYSLRQTEPLASATETVYGSHASRVQRIVTGYSAMDRSLGVILSGDKGMGKSLMLRLLAERMREEHHLPTVLVQHDTPGLAAFLDELGEVVVVFDEFEKIFSNEDDESQNQFLSLFDGLSTTKRLYVLSVNELHRVNDYMLNRPGRFHYHMRFSYPEPETVATLPA